MLLERRTILRAGLLAPFAPLTTFAQGQQGFALPKLDYAYDALEPAIDAQTMTIHHTKHHQAYVDNLNKALAAHADLKSLSIEELLRRGEKLPPAVQTAVRNNGGGHANHSLFWKLLSKKGSAPAGALKVAIDKAFGSRAGLEDKLMAAGLGQFGSGWSWLVLNRDRQLEVRASANQDSPLQMGQVPLAGIDVWEHAYYLRYQNRRADYLKAVMPLLNWDFVSAQYEAALKEMA
ncbi:MAG: superoxide dismutase [Bryobacter sp.]